VRAVVNEIIEADRERWRFEEGFALLEAAVARLLRKHDA
jgi:hypothetical protein